MRRHFQNGCVKTVQCTICKSNNHCDAMHPKNKSKVVRQKGDGRSRNQHKEGGSSRTKDKPKDGKKSERGGKPGGTPAPSPTSSQPSSRETSRSQPPQPGPKWSEPKQLGTNAAY